MVSGIVRWSSGVLRGPNGNYNYSSIFYLLNNYYFRYERLLN